MTGDRLVLSTVNVPFRRRIDAETLANCLRLGDAGDWVVHVAAFFVDVRPDLTIQFAIRHGIDLATLARSYRSVRDETGERSPAFEAELAKRENFT